MSFLKKLLKDTCGRPVLGWTACLLLVYSFLFFLFSRPFFQDLSIEILFFENVISSFIFLFFAVFFIGHGLMFAVHVQENKKNPWEDISFKSLFKAGFSFVACQSGLMVLGTCLILPFSMTTPHLAAFILLAYLLIIVTLTKALSLRNQT